MLSVAVDLAQRGPYALFRPVSVRPTLRGFRDHDAPLRVANLRKGQKAVSITALAARRCPTGRDLYLDKSHPATPSWARFVVGKKVDSILSALFERAVDHYDDALHRAFTGESVDWKEQCEQLLEQGQELVDEAMNTDVEDPAHPSTSIEAYAKIVSVDSALFEHTHLALRDLVRSEIFALDSYFTKLRRQYTPRWKRPAASWFPKFSAALADSEWILAARSALALLQIEPNLDGQPPPVAFGLSTGVRPDFVRTFVTVGDLKADEPHDFYDRVVAGYVIYAEAVWRRRINYGYLFFVQLDLMEGRLVATHIREVKVTDELRSTWQTQRDDAMSILGAKAEPQYPEDVSHCPGCRWYKHCWPSGLPRPGARNN